MADSSVLENDRKSEPLLEDDSLGSVLVRVQALEAFLIEATKDSSFSDFVREILIAFMKAVPSEAGSVLELNPEEQNLFFRAAVGQSADNVQSFTIPIGHGIVGHCIESKQTVIVNQVPENQLHLKSIAKAVGFETKNLIVVPIMIRGRIYGALELLNRIGEESYSDADAETLTYLADLVGKAFEIRLMVGWAAKKAGGSSG